LKDGYPFPTHRNQWTEASVRVDKALVETLFSLAASPSPLGSSFKAARLLIETEVVRTETPW